jgi:hypothetical protein
VTKVGANRTAQAGFDECVSDAATPFAFRPVRFPDRETCSFQVRDHPGLNDFGRWINNAADDARRIDVLADYSARIDALEMNTFPFASLLMEIPPRKSILCSDH